MKRDIYAKINLAIDVIGKCANGYHDVRMVMHQIDICDSIEVFLRHDGKILIHGENMPRGKDNIAYRAAEIMLSGTDCGTDITITKRIPEGAGMAGGSCDAAGVILILNELLGKKLSKHELMSLALPLGADVPYCIHGGAVLAEGIGEIITPLGSPPKTWYLIAKPKQSVSTAMVYGSLNFSKKPPGLDIDAVCRGVRMSNIELIAKSAGNVLENSTLKICPEVGILKSEIAAQGALLSLMSGSGSSVFGMFESENSARRAEAHISQIAPWTKVVRAMKG